MTIEERQAHSRAFGDYVRTRRKARGMTLRSFAKMINISVAYLSHIERGFLSPPVEEKIRAISSILCVHTDDLMSLAGKIPQDVLQVVQNPKTWDTVRNIKKLMGGNE